MSENQFRLVEIKIRFSSAKSAFISVLFFNIFFIQFYDIIYFSLLTSNEKNIRIFEKKLFGLKARPAKGSVKIQSF